MIIQNIMNDFLWYANFFVQIPKHCPVFSSFHLFLYSCFSHFFSPHLYIFMTVCRGKELSIDFIFHILFFYFFFISSSTPNICGSWSKLDSGKEWTPSHVSNTLPLQKSLFGISTTQEIASGIVCSYINFVVVLNNLL